MNREGAHERGAGPSPEPRPRARGQIEKPEGAISDSAITLVAGWATFDSEAVSSIRVRANGHSLGKVRIGLPRDDIAWDNPAAHAPLCGFQAWLGPEALGTDSERITVEAEVLGTRGGRLALTPITRQIIRSGSEGQKDFDTDSEYVLRVQERIRRIPRDARHTGSVRLLALTHELSRSGAPLYLLALLRRLVADGIECAVVSPRDGPLRRELESVGIPVHVSYMTWPGAAGYESKMWELTAWAAPQGFDIVHVNSIDSFIGTELAARLGIPAIWAIHESFTPDRWLAINEWSPHPHVRHRMLSGFQTASTVLVASDEERAGLTTYARPERISVLPYGLNLERIDEYREGVDTRALRQRLGFSTTETVLLSVASIEPRKAQTVMAQAFAELGDLPGDATLTLVGETGSNWTEEYVNGLREFVRRSGLSSRVRILPVTQNYYDWLAIADVFVLASDEESLPLAVLEAMAFELPVVATAVSGIPRAVQDGVTGFLCRPCDVSDLARALGQVLALRPEQRRDAGQKGAEIIRSSHDARRYAAQYASLVRALVADRDTLPSDVLARAGAAHRDEHVAADGNDTARGAGREGARASLN